MKSEIIHEVIESTCCYFKLRSRTDSWPRKCHYFIFLSPSSYWSKKESSESRAFFSRPIGGEESLAFSHATSRPKMQEIHEFWANICQFLGLVFDEQEGTKYLGMDYCPPLRQRSVVQWNSTMPNWWWWWFEHFFKASYLWLRTSYRKFSGVFLNQIFAGVPMGHFFWSVGTCVKKWRPIAAANSDIWVNSDNPRRVMPLAREGNQTNQSWWFLPWRILHQQLQLQKKRGLRHQVFFNILHNCRKQLYILLRPCLKVPWL